jgi:hypothetical protein
MSSVKHRPVGRKTTFGQHRRHDATPCRVASVKWLGHRAFVAIDSRALELAIPNA